MIKYTHKQELFHLPAFTRSVSVSRATCDNKYRVFNRFISLLNGRPTVMCEFPRGRINS